MKAKTQALQNTPITRFTGINTKTVGVSEPRGTLRIADGVNVTPVGALTFGPSWQSIWGLTTTYQATIDAALLATGAATNKVHFCTIAANGFTFLLAWEYQNGATSRARGIFHVGGTGDPDFGNVHAITLTCPTGTVYQGHTVGLQWYASWIADELWLGNGTDTNLVWAAGTLTVLGPASPPADTMDISQVAFPPCKSWVRSTVGVVYGAGNVTYPLRIWATELPNLNYPKPRGLKTSAYSWKDLQVFGSAIVALGFVEAMMGRFLMNAIVAHLDKGAPMKLTNLDHSGGGWKMDQSPMESSSGAINHNCVRDTKIAPFYLGNDLEIYQPHLRTNYDKTDWRDAELLTTAASGKWNVQATRPPSGGDYAVIYDEKGGRMWCWMLMAASARNGVWCWDQRASTITGPWTYPDFVSLCQLRDESLPGTIVLGSTRDGALLWSDVNAIGEQTLPAYSTVLGSPYLPLNSAPTSSPGIPTIGVDTVNCAFTQTLNGQTLYLSDPWAQWSASGSVVPTSYLQNARLSIVELSEDRLNSPDLQKEFANLRTFWARNAYAYVCVATEVNGYRKATWRGAYFPYESWISGISGMGATVKIRILVVSFNDLTAPAMLQSFGVDWLPGVMN